MLSMVLAVSAEYLSKFVVDTDFVFLGHALVLWVGIECFIGEQTALESMSRGMAPRVGGQRRVTCLFTWH